MTKLKTKYTPRLRPRDKTALKSALRSVLTKKGKRWVYVDGYSDAKVAVKLGASPMQVGLFRRKVFGSMAHGRPKLQGAEAPARSVELRKPLSTEERIALLERMVMILADRVVPVPNNLGK